MAYLKLLVPCFAALLLAGCGQFARQGELDKSLATWQALKVENGESYRYEVSSGSALTPPATTTLTVRNGAVIKRSYIFTDVNSTGEKVTESWTEEGATVGSHERGSEPLTLDERYQRCRNDVLSQSPITYEIRLEFAENGVLAYCAAFSKDIYYGGGFDGGGEYLDGPEFLRNPEE